MQQIKLNRGLTVPFEGVAAQAVEAVAMPAVIRIVPDHFAGVTPKLMVREGDEVKAGSPLFYSKQHEQMLFTSPVAGKVAAIVRGERRKVLGIDIEVAKEQAYEHFDTKLGAKLLLLQSGLWALMKQRPYDCIALPNKEPKAIFISTFDSAPAAPDYAWLLRDRKEDMQAAITALKQLAPVFVGLRAGDASFADLKDCTLYEVEGKHPAGNVGVQLNHVAPLKKGDTVFTINIQDLCIIGKLFREGIVDMQKVVALTGPMVKAPKYYRVLAGMPLSLLFEGKIDTAVKARLVAGNPLSGHQVEADEHVSVYDNQYCALSEGLETHEFMGWIMPHCKPMTDARLRGGRRAIIVSGEYEKVFPMDIYPEYLIKAMIAGNIDRMEQLGAYEVAPEDFALCEYICTSKMPLQAIVRQSLDMLKNEIE